MQSLAVKVGNKEDSISPVVGTECCNWIYDRWEDLISRSFQASKPFLDRHAVLKTKDAKRVLCHDPAG
jgi:hypothetical protein